MNKTSEMPPKQYELVELAPEPTANNKTIASICREEQILKKAKRKSNEEEHLLSVGSFRETEIELDVPKSPDLEKIMGIIEFQNIQFNYPLRPEVKVIRNFSLQIEAGLKAALAGPSGSGKSSVLALLLRIDDPGE
ncbi:hypothetical protein D5086_034000 [Populus alba]|uniref:Uncharacterized protein n=1 Tax=Populus alba TaxID=43335 RepID=A0ACC4AEJ0_POPAL